MLNDAITSATCQFFHVAFLVIHLEISRIFLEKYKSETKQVPFSLKGINESLQPATVLFQLHTSVELFTQGFKTILNNS